LGDLDGYRTLYGAETVVSRPNTWPTTTSLDLLNDGLPESRGILCSSVLISVKVKCSRQSSDFCSADVEVVILLAMDTEVAFGVLSDPLRMQFCGEFFGCLYWLRIHRDELP
jgi:hypothetical protein